MIQTVTIDLTPLLDGKSLAYEVIKEQSGRILDLVPLDPKSLVSLTNDKNQIIGWLQFGNPKKFEFDQILFLDNSLNRSIKPEKPWNKEQFS